MQIAKIKWKYKKYNFIFDKTFFPKIMKLFQQTKNEEQSFSSFCSTYRNQKIIAHHIASHAGSASCREYGSRTHGTGSGPWGGAQPPRGESA
jgi:hypothetical protein